MTRGAEIAGADPAVDPTQGPSTEEPVTGTTATLSVGASDPDGDDGALVAEWSVVKLPPGAPLPAFAPNGTTSALATTVTFAAVGDYQVRVRVRNADGAFVDAQVAVVVQATASDLRLQP